MPNATRPHRILAVDDDPLVLRMVSHLCADCGWKLETAATGETGVEAFTRFRPDALILDNILPDATGLEILRRLRSLDVHLPVLVVTAQGTTITAIEAMKWGAFDYLAKPLDLSHLQRQIERALEVRRLTRIPVERALDGAESSPADLLLGTSPAIRDILKTIGRVASQECPALIEGEPGTGKELVARLIHLHSARSSGPLVVLKCTDFAPLWLDGELFGHEAGALPGLAMPRAGRVEQAAGGMLVIDEVSALPLAQQSKLLRLLADRQFERLGATMSLAADVGVVAMSSQPLAPLVRQGVFRPELFYALSTFTIRLPPLRERREDIPPLVEHFVKRFSGIGRTFHVDTPRVSPEAMALLTAYHWPGNIDELQSVIRRALVETGGAVIACDSLEAALPGATTSADPSVSDSAADWASSLQAAYRAFVANGIGAGATSLLALAQEQMERHVLQTVLDHTRGNQAQAARQLGITRGHLRKKIRLLGLNLPGVEEHQGEADTESVGEGT